MIDFQLLFVYIGQWINNVRKIQNDLIAILNKKENLYDK